MSKKAYYDPCQEKVVTGRDIPCYEKKGAARRKTPEMDCSECRYFPGNQKKGTGSGGKEKESKKRPSDSEKNDDNPDPDIA